MAWKNTKYSRRDFIKGLGAFAGLTLIRPGALSLPVAAAPGSFGFLVVGDSIIAGQGLREEQKFYYLVKQWLEIDVFNNSRRVDMKVKAHSGASIELKPKETDALKKAGIGETKFFPSEVNITFPSIRAQVDAARKEYEDPRLVDLVMLTGGITDARLSTILDPFRSNDELRREIVKHCNEGMFELLKYMAESFPNALIAVVGYYPMLSKHTPKKKIINHLLELRDIPQPLKPLINNPLNRRLFKYRSNKMVKRSLIWANDSTVEFKKAVERVNTAAGSRRAVFIGSPIGEENSLGTKKTLLYELGKNGRAMDAMATERKTVCKDVLAELRESTDLKFNTRQCEIASIGHPDPAGAKAIATAIQNDLKQFFTKTSAAT